MCDDEIKVDRYLLYYYYIIIFLLSRTPLLRVKIVNNNRNTLICEINAQTTACHFSERQIVLFSLKCLESNEENGLETAGRDKLGKSVCHCSYTPSYIKMNLEFYQVS